MAKFDLTYPNRDWLLNVVEESSKVVIFCLLRFLVRVTLLEYTLLSLNHQPLEYLLPAVTVSNMYGLLLETF